MEQQPAPASERGGDTRDRLIAATVAVITKSGWSGVTTRSVAEQADANPALVHYHFGSVAALRRAAVVHALEAMAGPFLAEMGGADPPDAQAALGALVEATIDVELDQPEASVLIEAMLQAPRDPELGAQVKDVLHMFRRLLADQLRAGQASGQLRDNFDPDATAVLMTAMLDGLLLHRLLDPSMDTDAIRTAFLQLLEVNR